MRGRQRAQGDGGERREAGDQAKRTKAELGQLTPRRRPTAGEQDG